MRLNKSFFIVVVTSCIYFSLAILLLNTTLLTITFSSPTIPFSDKLLLVWHLILAAPNVLAPLQLVLLSITALFVGLNLSIAYALFARTQKMQKATALSGSGSVMGMVSVGCVSCGYPILSTFGLSGSLAILPFHGSEIYFIAILLLTISLMYNFKKLHSPVVCKKR